MKREMSVVVESTKEGGSDGMRGTGKARPVR